MNRLRSILGRRVVRVGEIPVRSINETKYRIRTSYDPGAMSELAESQENLGQIQPILVTPTTGQKYNLIYGSRRLLSLKKKGKQSVTATIVTGVTDQDAIVIALAENLQRESLTPFEEGAAILKLIKEYEMQPAEVGKMIGKKLPWVTGRLRLLGAPKELQEMYTKKSLSLGHIEALALVTPPERQVQLAREAVKSRLSASELVELLREEGAREVQERRSRAIITSKKARLRIRGFEKYLRLTLSKLKGNITYGETHNLKVALRSLSKAIENILKELED